MNKFVSRMVLVLGIVLGFADVVRPQSIRPVYLPAEHHTVFWYREFGWLVFPLCDAEYGKQLEELAEVFFDAIPYSRGYVGCRSSRPWRGFEVTAGVKGWKGRGFRPTVPWPVSSRPTLILNSRGRGFNTRR